MDLRFALLNVFSIDGDPFSGNPLCVFEDAAALTDRQMQAWARQFNLSETTFVTAMHAGSAGVAEADVRVFTASYEMPFAGHPTLGTAHVVAASAGGIDEVALSLPAGRIPVRRVGEGWRLRANSASARSHPATVSDIAEVLGLGSRAVASDGAHRVDSGVEQVLVELVDADAVHACRPDPSGLREHLSVPGREPQVYVWARTGQSTVSARFFAVSGTVLEEDPATGSAAANLGSWLAVTGRRGEAITISQGDQVARPSRLELTVDDHGTVFVGGRVTEVGGGTVRATEG
ncbi:PhzF family phenazine biosynthesis protein [Intrasporangium sp.]|uniref:PhzF family phenazine biosynthesis protein n=1 Tax=Intrasporangium sp. TaxID=1925024 RepID=UPI0033654C1A